MASRHPSAYGFYGRDCTQAQIEKYVEGFRAPAEPAKVVAGVVPHAGWAYSGAVAAKVLKCVKEKGNPSTFIVLSAIHRWGVQRNAVYARGAWWTPWGDIEVDSEMAAMLLQSSPNECVEDTMAHSQEHSAEVQMPLIKYFFPQAKVVPVIVLPYPGAAALGQKIGEVVVQSKKEVVVLGTTDLTHYGPNYGFTPVGTGPRALQWFKENDARITSLALAMKAEDIVPEAAQYHNACGAGAMAAAIAAGRAMGARKGVLVEYTTSYDVMREGDFQMGVGYAGIVF